MKLSAGAFTRTGIHIRYGLDVWVKGSGILNWKSGRRELDNEYYGSIKAFGTVENEV